MNTNERKPLIRKKYNLTAVLKMLFSKMTGGKTKKEMQIPGIAETVEFKSLISEHEIGGSAKIDYSPDYIMIIEAMKTNLLCGYGGAGYPMADKIKTAMEASENEPVLIINGVECDPGLYHDKWILENRQEELEEIVRVLKQALGLSKIYLAKRTDVGCSKISSVIAIDVPETYPAGEEKRLASYLLGIDCDENTYPAEMGIWVQNIQSLLSLRSVLAGVPLGRYLTMTDLDEKKAVVVECESGDYVFDLADEVFGNHDRLHLGGGIMQGFPACENRKIDSRINLIATGKTAEFSDTNCRHCKQCTTYCPAGLQLEELIAGKMKGNPIPEEQRNKCIRCGACSYICPAGKDVCSIITT